jgi:hypothetical protein
MYAFRIWCWSALAMAFGLAVPTSPNCNDVSTVPCKATYRTLCVVADNLWPSISRSSLTTAISVAAFVVCGDSVDPAQRVGVVATVGRNPLESTR